MNFCKINLFCACVVVLALIVPVYNAPSKSRSKGHSSTSYDQHQSGDYNFQVRLKDFRIITLLGGDPWGGSGDLDYNYDYSDLTIKPIVSITTDNPQDSTTSHSSEATGEVQKPENDTEIEKPSEQPYPMVTPLTTVDNSEKSTTLQLVQSSTTLQPQSSTTPLSAISVSIVTAESEPPQRGINKSENVASSTQKPAEDPQKSSTVLKEQVPQKSTKLENSGVVPEEADEKKTESSVTNISIVPSESNSSTQSDHHVPLGEIMHYRKCAEGYGKDKLGRCRKIIRRTPQLPYGITRFASSLASRFRQATSGSSSPPAEVK